MSSATQAWFGSLKGCFFDDADVCFCDDDDSLQTFDDDDSWGSRFQGKYKNNFHSFSKTSPKLSANRPLACVTPLSCVAWP